MNFDLGSLRSVKEVFGCKANCLPAEILASSEPLILRKVVADWPMVKVGQSSIDGVNPYLLQFYTGQEVSAFLGKPENKGRLFYNESMSGFNYDIVHTKLDFALEQLRLHKDSPFPPAIYLGSKSVDAYLPGFRAENDLELAGKDPLVSIWISNKCRAAAHWDSPSNIACCVAGRRRFTVFPFDQIDNLYPGPLDKTPAGQEISLVDFYNPDFEKFPKFQEALKHAQVADLEPGDALYLPSMWWHHVESLSTLNVLVNYWSRQLPAFYGAPIDVLQHAILSLRGLPAEQRAAWRNMFDHYIFNYDENNFDYIPESGRGILAEIGDESARKIRAMLLSKLNR